MAARYSTDYRNIRPYVLEDVRNIVNATGAGGTGGSSSALTAHALNGPYHTGQLDPSQATWALTISAGDARYITSTRQVIAGSGLTGGGALSADVTLNVGAGAGITVNADDIALTTPGTLTVSSTNTATGSHTHAITASADVGTSPAAALLKSTAGGGLTLGSATTNQAVSLAAFASGFAGSGWRADYGITTAARASIETDDLTVRGRMRVYELLIQQIRATNGSVFVSSASKVVSVTGATNPAWTVNGNQLTFNGSNATLTTTLYTITTAAAGDTSRELYHGFLVGDVIRAKQVRWDGAGFAGMIQSDLEVTKVTDLYTYQGTFVSGDAPAISYDYVRLGNTSDTTRQGAVYLTSDDSAAPFVDIVDGVRYHSDWNTPGKIRVRVGQLSGITGSAAYGLFAGDKSAAWLNVDATTGLKFSFGSQARLTLGINGDMRIYDGSGNMSIAFDGGGNSYFAGVMTIGTSGEIRQGTGTLGSNYTGLRIWHDTGVGRIGGYNSNTLQWYANTDGKLYAGGGAVWLDSYGLSILAPGVDDLGQQNNVSWPTQGNTGTLSAYINAGFVGTSGSPKGVMQLLTNNYNTSGSNINMVTYLVSMSNNLSVTGSITAGDGKLLSDSTIQLRNTADNAYQNLYVGYVYSTSNIWYAGATHQFRDANSGNINPIRAKATYLDSGTDPGAVSGQLAIWFDGTNLRATLPGGTTKTFTWS